MNYIFKKIFKYQINKFTELNNIIIKYILNIPKLKIKKTNIIY